ncbi:MAG: ATP-dependent sacrificial sulfur transferase LarE [Thermoplasmata archaeon]|nr:MAG: ATP-dependent sacrificial sulfur transferase LarE [Thermoplasmata archaeon]
MADEEPLRAAIRNSEKLLVAFSGGLDSAVIAKLAADELGDNALAVTVDSETMPRAELDECKRLVKEVGIRHHIVKRSDLADESFTKNPVNRCYYCRSGIADMLKAVAAENGIKIIADGANSTDLDDFRPGLKAFEEAGIWHPFIEFGFHKSDVRDLARKLDLSIKDKPSMACLASRFPYHEIITEAKLRRVESAENFIKNLNFSQVRVRHLKDNVARIEVLKDELANLIKPSIRDLVLKHLKELGFRYVTIDLEGYRSGSMNLNLSEKDKLPWQKSRNSTD